jgi:hypothetical protein
MLKQFYLDAPRMDIFIDGTLCTEEPEYIEKYIRNTFEEQANDILFTMTQTFMADFYAKEYHKKMISEEFLLDNGNYSVKINTIHKIVNVEKDFKLIYFNSPDSFYLLNYCTLDITICTNDMSIFYIWNYDLEDSSVPVDITIHSLCN